MLLRGLVRLLVRLGIGVVGSCAVNALGIAALYVTTAPPAISLLIEPICMLMLPGLMVSAVFAGARDFHPTLLLRASLLFYFGFFVVMAMWWERRGRWWRRRSR